MLNKKYTGLLLLLMLAGFSRLSAQQGDTAAWRGELHRQDGIVIPFTFISDLSGSNIYLVNGNEKLMIEDVQMQGDSAKVTLPFFDAYFMVAPVADNLLKGTYYKVSGDKTTQYAFEAKARQPRFTRTAPARFDITGRWAINFTGNERPDAGIFTQDAQGNITGTILTPTGDYRYMQGIVDDDSLMMSVFDGGFTMLLTARINDRNTLQDGFIYSGATGVEKWEATRNDTLQVGGEELTKMRPGEDRLNFTFNATNGKKISINDPQYKNKVVLVQIMGSWCPNCMDETAFLSDYYRQNKQRGLEVIGLAYERTTNVEKNKKLLQPYIDRFQVEYPILLPPASVSDPEKEQKTLPQVEKIRAFPSLIIIGKDGLVRKIHSGFSGPATGELFEQYKKDFYMLMDQLLAE